MRFVTPPHESAWMPVNQTDMNPREFAYYRASIQELARQSDMSPDEVVQIIDEWNDVAATSAELDRKIADERRKLELAKLNNKLDKFDEDVRSMKAATKSESRRIDLSNQRPDMSDPQYFPRATGQPFASGSGGYVSPEEPAWQAERRAQQNQDLAEGRIVGQPWESVHDYRPGGVQRFDDMGSSNHPMAPQHTEYDEFENHQFRTGVTPGEAFVAAFGDQLKAGPKR